MKPPRPSGPGFASRAYAPGEENNKHFHIAPLDPVLKDGRCLTAALRPRGASRSRMKT